MSSITNNQTENNYKINFYVWGGRGFGHFATECERADGTKTYHSLYPKTSASLWSGLATWLHPGHVVSSYEQDAEKEKPSHVISFPVDQETAQKVENYMKESAEAINLEKKKYCLTPNTPLSLFACRFLAYPRASFIAEPEEMFMHRFASAPIHPDDEEAWEGIQSVETAHCTTEAENIAKLIMPVPENHRPWGYSPASFSNYLAKAPNAEVRMIEHRKPSKPGDIDEDLFPAP